MRMPERGFRIFGEWPLSTAMLDVAPTELGVFRGWCSYKDVAPTELGIFRGSCSYKDVAPTELGVFRGWCSYKGVAPTELGGLADRVAIKISFPRGLSESASLTKMQN